MFKNILKKITFATRVNKLFAKYAELKAAKEAVRTSGISLGGFMAVSKKIDHRLLRIERALYRVGKIDTLTFQAAI